MLYVAAVLLVLVGLMHSVKGGRNLIEPILRDGGAPPILGGIRDTRFTLRAGWHLLTLFWWANAAVLVSMELNPSTVNPVFLLANALICGGTALASLLLTEGRHLSWIFFLPIAAILGQAGLASLS